ncbi:LysR family transcriptional regulator [Pantoea rodasii]|uniref:LysR family transcriptional regulator n=1 Tax=Pantoea rodasii TaxID=1076549 RepID=A0A2M9WJ35_9GAMM|nr:LysR family transcriptional regulator [Pantoea rodasii]ORM61851.1 LysR family transcriptional regulator [Pantoea rodasii]PJZ07572.1 LysR family transcriptional regulator [Pantoea rodasii]
MDIKLLRSFATVALLEHVGQAAEKLHISASPLSRQIQQLENELGVTLFHREKKRLRLTEAGRKFLDEVTPFLQHHARLTDYGHSLTQAESVRLDIGYVEAAIHSRILPNAIARIDPQSGIAIHLHAMRSKQQRELLEERALDVALLHTPPEKGVLFSQKKVLTEPVLLAMPKAQAIAAPTPADLQKQRWIADHAHLNPAARARLLAACEQAGFQPGITLEVNGPLAALACVEAGLGFTFIQQSLAISVPDTVSLVMLPWLPLEITLYAVWRKDDARPLIHDFLKAINLAEESLL